MLDNVGLTEALACAEAFRRAIYDLDMPHARSAHKRVTVSIGVSAVQPRELPASIVKATAASGTAEMLGRADQALYEAKAAGRNRVMAIALASAEIAAPPIAAAVPDLHS